MAFDDKKLGTIFPVRTGIATGSSNERQMLQSSVKVESFVTRIRNGADGSTTIMRTKGGMPQFETTRPYVDEEKCPGMYLESGLIDLVNISLTTGNVPAYWYPLAALDEKKWVGKVAFDGKLRNSPKLEAIQLSKAATEECLDKKRMMAKCPPSMYTGRMRSYVQALYGMKYTEDFPLMLAFSLGPPTIDYMLDWDFLDPESRINFGINTGIFTDDKHRFWMLDIIGSGVKIRRLKTDKCTDALRKNLARRIKKGTITQREIDQIEAYIFSKTIPTKEYIVLPLSVPASAGIAYGWHYDWDGKHADIVSVDSTGDRAHFRYVSNHYRITVAMEVDSITHEENWTASLSLVEGPVEWKNRTYSDVIGVPDWLYNLTYIYDGFFSRHGKSFGNAAPFYVFYNRDTLYVCRYSYTEDNRFITEYETTSSHPSFNPSGAYGMVFNDGVHTYTHSTHAEYQTTVYVGTLSFGVDCQSGSFDVVTAETVWDGNVGDWYSYVVPDGLTESIAINGGTYEVHGPATVTYNETATGYGWVCSESYTVGHSGSVLTTIPFYDAEAIYVAVANNYVKSWFNYGRTDVTNATWADTLSVRKLSVDGVEVDTSFWGGSNFNYLYAAGTSVDTSDIPDAIDEVSQVCSLIAINTVTPVDTNVFHLSATQNAPNDYYGLTMPFVGARSSSGAIYKTGIGVSNLPIPVSSIGPYCLVGWI